MNAADVRKVAVLGAGTMGPGLALVFAMAGRQVSLYSRKRETLDKAMATASESLDTLVEHEVLSRNAAASALALIRPTRSLEQAGDDADLAIETIIEAKEAKRDLYERLDAVCPEKTVFASNTSSLNIFDLMPVARLPRTVIGHFFAPAHIIPLVEVVPSPQTSPETLSRLVALLEQVGKSPVVMKKFGPGFIVNRIQRAIGETVLDMIEEGLAGPVEVDRAVKLSLGVRLPVVGVVQTFDFQGLDMLLSYQRNVGKVYSLIEERVGEGALGAKTSRGIYDYQGRTEAEILRKRDGLYLKMLGYLQGIDAFSPV